ncbi:MAG TPA: RES family NAD+ phosphorylase [Terriglobales bacterium]|nr:RES family NAD+ phosphorylase [Terriglobales bacterium]
MLLWRISNHASLDGEGGVIASARWHFQGTPIVYLAETPAGSLLEVLVRLELTAPDLPPNYKLLKIQAPDPITPQMIEENTLPSGWRDDQRITRKIGADWLARGEAALARVPSAIVPETFNVLLNPLHRDAAKLEIVWHRSYPWDYRLLRRH